MKCVPEKNVLIGSQAMRVSGSTSSSDIRVRAEQRIRMKTLLNVRCFGVKFYLFCLALLELKELDRELFAIEN